MGGKKLYHLLKEQLVSQGIKLGRDALFDFLAANTLLIRRRERKTITTFSRHKFRKYPHLINDLTAQSGLGSRYHPLVYRSRLFV